MPSNSKIDKKLFLSCCYAYFINGLLVLMTGAILTYLMNDYNLTYNQGGLVITMQAVGNLLAGLISGFIINLLGRKNTMLIVALLFSIGFGGIIFVSSPALLFILMFLTGAGWGINNNMLNVLVSEATKGDSAYANILHMSFAVGAFISPLIISAFIGWNISWKVAVGIVSLAALTLIPVFLKAPLGDTEADKTMGGKLSFDFLKDPQYYILMMIFFCYVGAETGLNSWLITYLVDEGIMNMNGASLMLSLLWVSIIFGRIIVAFISKYIRKELLLTGISLSMLVFFGVFIIGKDPKIAILAIIFLGLSMAGIYPTTVANASSVLTGAGLASGIMFAGGGLGASVIPYITGAIAEKNGIKAGFISTLVVVFIMVILAIINIKMTRKERVR